MPFQQQTVIEQVRAITGYSEDLISEQEMETLYQAAVADIEGIIGESPEEFNHPAAERAAFWSTALFSKILMGEMEGIDMKIGSIQIEQFPRRDITRVWYRRLDEYLNVLRTTSGTGGITAPSRQDRVYGEGSTRELI